MLQGNDTTYYQVRLIGPDTDGWRQWGATRGELGRKLAGQAKPRRHRS